jgi:DNA-binding NarL/FixJ family response regulator
MLTVAVVDDHELIRYGIVKYLSQQVNLAIGFETGNPIDLEKRLSRTPVDLLLLDIGMPTYNAVQTVRSLKKQIPAMRVLIVSSHDAPSLVSSLVEAGVDGYYVKSDALEMLGEAVRAVMANHRWFSQSLVHSDSLDAGGSATQLTARERKALSLMCSTSNINEVAEALLISPRIAQAHINSIQLKLGVGNWSEAVAQGIRKGIITGSVPDS